LVGLYEVVCAEGVDPMAVSDACGLSRAVWFDGGDEVPLSSFVLALERVAESSGSPDFGWRAGRDFDLHCLGEFGNAILAAPTVGAALKTFADGLRLVQSTTELRFEIEGERALIGYRILDPDIWPRCQDAEFSLSILRNLLNSGTRGDRGAVEIIFEHPTMGDRGFEGSTKDSSGRGNALTFPVAFLGRSMSGYSRNCWQERSLSLRTAMVERNRKRPVSAKTETAILRSFGNDKPSQRRIAEELGLSVRSLHRHLKAEGESFSRILTDCRLRFARHMLTYGDQPLSEIALELGFEDQSCLSRFFQYWTGQSPSGLRDVPARQAVP
jgi:AraC-like DNA-binding protein